MQSQPASISEDELVFVPSVPKTDQWSQLFMFEMIAHYGQHLGAVHRRLTDKLLAKAYVSSVFAKRGLDNVGRVPKVVRVLEGPDDLKVEDLAVGRIVKAAHGSKWNIVGKAQSPADVDECKTKLRGWMRTYSSPFCAQKQYDGIEPRFFVEELVNDGRDGPDGFGLCYMIRFVRGQALSLNSTFGREQNAHSVETGQCTERKTACDHVDLSPTEFRNLMEVAKALAAPFEFVRMDCYVTKGSGEVYFSELTFTPAAGRRRFQDSEEKRQAAAWVAAEERAAASESTRLRGHKVQKLPRKVVAAKRSTITVHHKRRAKRLLNLIVRRSYKKK
jgi:hypothetical protein